MTAFDDDKTATVKATKTNNNLKNFRTKSMVPFRVTGRSAINLYSIRHDSWYSNDRRNQTKHTRDLSVRICEIKHENDKRSNNIVKITRTKSINKLSLVFGVLEI